MRNASPENFLRRQMRLTGPKVQMMMERRRQLALAAARQLAMRRLTRQPSFVRRGAPVF